MNLRPDTLTLSVLAGRLAIVRMPPDAPPPAPPAGAVTLWSLTRTADELSLVCDEAAAPHDAPRTEPGWKALRVHGPIPFDVTGVIAGLTASLAAAGIPVFVISTYDTDYLMVREIHLERALEVLAGRFQVV
jgi:hypothetical protein